MTVFGGIARLIIVSLAASIGSADADDLESFLPPGDKIVNGTPAASRDWPWMAALGHASSSGTDYFCGGVVIASEWVVTAAHCLERKPNVVVIGGKSLVAAEGKDRFGVREVHDRTVEKGGGDSSKNDMALNDIALIRLDRPWMGAVLPLSAIRQSDPDRGHFMLAGHGSTEGPKEHASQGSKSVSADSIALLQAKLPPVPTSDCRLYFESRPKTFWPIDDKAHICAGYAKATISAACFGDSGGPLVARDKALRPYLVGLVSWGYQEGDKCLTQKPYAVFTRVSHHEAWLRSKVGSILTMSYSRSEAAGPDSFLKLEQLLARLKGASSVTLRLCSARGKGDCGTSFRRGEQVKLTVQSPVSGYLMLVDDNGDSGVRQKLPDPQGGNIMHGSILANQPFDYELSFDAKKGNRLIAIVLPLGSDLAPLVGSTEVRDLGAWAWGSLDNLENSPP